MLCFDIFVHNVFIYRIKLIDVHHAFRPYDTALFLYFVNIVKEKYMHMQNNCADDVTQLQKYSFLCLILIALPNLHKQSPHLYSILIRRKCPLSALKISGCII